jgi:hypothetical protein
VLRIVLLGDDYHVLDRRGGLHAVMTLVVVVIVRERRCASKQPQRQRRDWVAYAQRVLITGAPFIR